MTAGPAGGLGLVLPTTGVTGDPSWARVAACATEAEQAGAGAVWVTDHLFWHQPVLDCLTALTVAALNTAHIAIGTAVLQVPLRTTGSVARAAASIQDLSRGRLVLGVGAGQHRREFTAAGVDAEGRGPRLDDAIGRLRDLWDGTGAHRRYELLPEPEPIPIWVGGGSPSARRRAALLGDGWFPLGLTPAELASGAADVGEQAAAAGRAVQCSSLIFFSIDPDHDRAVEQGVGWLSEFFRVPDSVARRLLVAGTADECAEVVEQHRAAGAGHVCALIAADDPRDGFAQLITAVNG